MGGHMDDFTKIVRIRAVQIRADKVLHEILATNNFGEFQKFAKISCRLNLLPPKLINAKIIYILQSEQLPALYHMFAYSKYTSSMQPYVILEIWPFL